MANEIRVTAKLACVKNGATVAGEVSLSQTQAGTNSIGNVQNVGTVAEALVVGDVSTIGYVMVKNLDSTNYVEIDAANTFDKFPQKLLPGEAVLLKPQTATLYGKANTAACDVLVVACEL